MGKQKLKWTDIEEIAFRLIDEHPKMDPLKVRFTDLHRFITGLPEFSDSPKKSNEKILEEIQMRWYEERQDMEDELGPVKGGTDPEDEETLDEDDYRDDQMVDDDLGSDDDQDDDEDELGDGFQEEEGPDER